MPFLPPNQQRQSTEGTAFTYTLPINWKLECRDSTATWSAPESRSWTVRQGDDDRRHADDVSPSSGRAISSSLGTAPPHAGTDVIGVDVMRPANSALTRSPPAASRDPTAAVDAEDPVARSSSSLSRSFVNSSSSLPS